MFPSTYRVDYPQPAQASLASLVVFGDDLAKVAACLEDLVRQDSPLMGEVLVAWSGPERLAPSAGEREGWVCADNAAAALNAALKRARGSVVVVMGQDVTLEEGACARLISQACRDGVVASAPKLLYEDDVVRSLGVVVSGGVPVRFDEGAARHQMDMHLLTRYAREVTAPECDCFAACRDIVVSVGGLDERLPLPLAVLEWSFRLAEHGSVVVDPEAEAMVKGVRHSADAHLLCNVPDGSPDDRERMMSALREVALAHPRRFALPDPHYNVNYAEGSARFELWATMNASGS